MEDLEERLKGLDLVGHYQRGRGRVWKIVISLKNPDESEGVPQKFI